MSDGHVYLSTSCLHGEHGRCADKGAKCKFCPAACICPCHVMNDLHNDVRKADHE